MNSGMAKQATAAKPRKVWIAVLFSLLMPGLGQVYNGQFRKAMGFYLLTAIPSLLVLLFVIRLPIVVSVVAFLFPLTIQILAIVDSIRTARRLGSAFQPKRYNRALVYIAIYLVVGVLAELVFTTYVKLDVVQSYKIPAGSMKDTLLIGDHILVDKSIKTISRGDIVVFEFPEDAGKEHPRDFIKRVVGMPGDKIEIRDKRLFVNDRPVIEDYVVHFDSRLIPENAGPRDYMAAVVVPEGNYFTLGDNRDYSYDSRFWGFVDVEKISGRADKIYWSWDRKETRVRWGRIGREIR